MIKRGLVVAMSLAAAGCAVVGADKSVDTAAKSTEAMRELVSRNATAGGIERTSMPRLAGEEFEVKSNALPPVFETRATYVSKGSQSLVQVLEDISTITGLSIRTAEIAQGGRQGDASFNAGQQNGTDALTGAVSIEFSGKVRALLDEVAAKGNVSWRRNPKNGVVEFFRYETRMLPVYVPAGVGQVSSSISLAGVSGGGSGSGSGTGASTGGAGGGGVAAGNVTVTSSQPVDPWSSIVAGVNAILGSQRQAAQAPMAQQAQGQGGAAGQQAGAQPGLMLGSQSGTGESVIPNPDLGSITVIARPATMARVVNYIDSINERFSKNILIDVKLYSVTLSDQSSLGFNLNMLYNSLNKLAVTTSGPAAFQAGVSTPGVITITSKDPTSRWVDSSVVGSALAQYGNVALTTQRQILAVNGQPAPVQLVNKITYKNGASVVPQNGNQGSIVASTQGNEVVGFTANFIPMILDDNRIRLGYSMNISQLAQPLTPDAQGIQSPNVSQKSLPGNAFVRDGQAIVLFGSSEERTGIDAAAHFGGASKAVTKDKTVEVIVVQVTTGAKNGDL